MRFKKWLVLYAAGLLSWMPLQAFADSGVALNTLVQVLQSRQVAGAVGSNPLQFLDIHHQDFARATSKSDFDLQFTHGQKAYSQKVSLEEISTVDGFENVLNISPSSRTVSLQNKGLNALDLASALSAKDIRNAVGNKLVRQVKIRPSSVKKGVETFEVALQLVDPETGRSSGEMKAFVRHQSFQPVETSEIDLAPKTYGVR